MDFIKLSLCMVVLTVIVASCSLLGSKDDDEKDDKPVTYTLSTSAMPQDGGTVSVTPSRTGYEAGTVITLSATPAQGYMFKNWTGSQQSSDNPLKITINKNTSLTANFALTSPKSVYSVDLQLVDSLAHSLTLTFGQAANATNGLDTDLDKDAPPDPPAGALNAYFDTEGKKLWADFRADTTTSLSWNINYQMGAGDSLQLSWSGVYTNRPGILNLRNEDASVNINMNDVSSAKIPVSASGTLTIEYTLGN